ncbi:MAG: hypothetical protein WD341_09785 [Tistlia sp.]|uniref:hypothetical protein n=1 Tax=Tistlia sp. TaxID=3057121 RepID=UPI0034A16F8C
MTTGSTTQGHPPALRQLILAAERPDARPFELRRFEAAESALAAAPHFAFLIDLWRSRRGACALPDWADVEFPDFRGWHSALLLSDLPDETPDPRFRLIGEDYRVLQDSSLPGRRFSDVMPRLYARQFRAHFEAIRDGGLIGLTTGPAAFVGREHLHLSILELPFRAGGTGVQRLLHALRVGASAQP